jgi:hypothetical protein
MNQRSLPTPASAPGRASSNSSRPTSATRTPGGVVLELQKNFDLLRKRWRDEVSSMRLSV